MVWALKWLWQHLFNTKPKSDLQTSLILLGAGHLISITLLNWGQCFSSTLRCSRLFVYVVARSKLIVKMYRIRMKHAYLLYSDLHDTLFMLEIHSVPSITVQNDIEKSRMLALPRITLKLPYLHIFLYRKLYITRQSQKSPGLCVNWTFIWLVLALFWEFFRLLQPYLSKIK